jgi:hypothetical protein
LSYTEVKKEEVRGFYQGLFDKLK